MSRASRCRAGDAPGGRRLSRSVARARVLGATLASKARSRSHTPTRWATELPGAGSPCSRDRVSEGSGGRLGPLPDRFIGYCTFVCGPTAVPEVDGDRSPIRLWHFGRPLSGGRRGPRVVPWPVPPSGRRTVDKIRPSSSAVRVGRVRLRDGWIVALTSEGGHHPGRMMQQPGSDSR